jgi:hypothetical protein
MVGFRQALKIYSTLGALLGAIETYKRPNNFSLCYVPLCFTNQVKPIDIRKKKHT